MSGQPNCLFSFLPRWENPSFVQALRPSPHSSKLPSGNHGAPMALQGIGLGFLHGRDHTRDFPFHPLDVAKSGCDVCNCDTHAVTAG